MNPWILAGSLVALATAVTKVFDYLEEADIRRRQQEIREEKTKYAAVKQANRKLANSLRAAHLKKEEIWHRALTNYYRQRNRFAEKILVDVRKAKMSSYDHVSYISKRVHELPGWKGIPDDAKRRFEDGKQNIHTSIAKLKAYELIIREEIKCLDLKRAALRDREHSAKSTRNAISDHLNSIIMRSQSTYRHSDACALLLPVNGTDLRADFRTI